MNAHILQHVPFEGIGSMAKWLTESDATVTTTRFFESEILPDPKDIDLLIVMGGPMSVNDEETLPWLRKEKQFIRQVIGNGTPVLGVCLGAQLIANSMGAKVYPNRLKEIGWFDIESVPAPTGSFQFPESAQVFHWHGETFDLPPGATRLAQSTACGNQAFQLGNRVLGLQFHLETTPTSADTLIRHCETELVEGEYIQTESQMRAAPPILYANANQLMKQVLAWLTRP